MDIVVTGANGFLGKHLTHALEQDGHNVLKVTRETHFAERSRMLRAADFVFHLAGINRPEDPHEFITGNVDLTEVIATELLSYNPVPIVFASSIQATQDNDYGRSKRDAENMLVVYSERSETRVHLFRLPNVFGKWGRPFYNSAVTTFCHQIARGETVTVNDPDRLLTLAHVDDVVASFLETLTTDVALYPTVPAHEISLLDVVRTLEAFETMRAAHSVPDLSDAFTKQLYSTYTSYLPRERMVTPLLMHRDARGSFTEFLKTPDRGQVSVNVAKLGIKKGEHWHDTKHEQFLVVSGEGVIRLRLVDDTEVMTFHVSGETLEVVEIPPGYVHNIENVGTTDLVTIMWVNEPFDPGQPDTYSGTVARAETEVL
ncbi:MULTISPECIES: NAD-dependent epimerase/dehydratase family protein [unclassified Exiguobacterium]|uniref:polysaccharide biosynthesis C-terminal domain-containing protein n=1 Tax=unclassified Exiguobacterium TaxID=2644629 RepID=UPI00103F2D12|nr:MULTISPECIES: NAD-dependent epimerase/dehydratase family protein [unclassified Exiguobacterium]TCI48234.1 SDR family oxidoreductase [Exiguobacterium sp. SH5S32]TCI55121.1 SDR family oxidoreductase [Exiguobacterium sp. SH1S4]TCI74914.1 SDR family oxidoreductase [Exiguobacterium sp. SH1S1]